MKLKDVFVRSLHEEKEKSLKLFFLVDIFIQGFKKGDEGDSVEEPVKESYITEDIFKFNSQGEVPVPMDDVNNIQTIDDLVDYISDIHIGGKPIINKLVEEIILSMAGAGDKAIEDVVNEGDKILVDIDYGADKKDSIGFKINKINGSAAISLVMKKDNKIIPGQFDINEFNKQLIFFRNSLVG